MTPEERRQALDKALAEFLKVLHGWTDIQWNTPTIQKEYSEHGWADAQWEYS